MIGSDGDKDSELGMKRFSELVDVLCKVINDCNEKGYWVVQCDGICFKGGFEGEDKSSLEVVMRGNEDIY